MSAVPSTTIDLASVDPAQLPAGTRFLAPAGQEAEIVSIRREVDGTGNPTGIRKITARILKWDANPGVVGQEGEFDVDERMPAPVEVFLPATPPAAAPANPFAFGGPAMEQPAPAAAPPVAPQPLQPEQPVPVQQPAPVQQSAPVAAPQTAPPAPAPDDEALKQAILGIFGGERAHGSATVEVTMMGLRSKLQQMGLSPGSRLTEIVESMGGQAGNHRYSYTFSAEDQAELDQQFAEDPAGGPEAAGLEQAMDQALVLDAAAPVQPTAPPEQPVKVAPSASASDAPRLTFPAEVLANSTVADLAGGLRELVDSGIIDPETARRFLTS